MADTNERICVHCGRLARPTVPSDGLDLKWTHVEGGPGCNNSYPDEDTGNWSVEDTAEPPM